MMIEVETKLSHYPIMVSYFIALLPIQLQNTDIA